MKKLLLLGALSLAIGGLGSGQASAGLFHLCGCQCECNGYRPYNAFDPGCSGCQEHRHGCLFGCLCHGHGHAPPCFVPPPCFMPPPYVSSCYNGMCGNSSMNSGCCDAGCLPAPDAAGAPAATPAPAGQILPAPTPSPLPDTSQMYNYPMQYPQNMVNAGGNYPGYYSGYYPGYPTGNYAPMQGYPMQYGAYGMPGYGYNFGR
jgi:hypothetical protein